jgi:hypothetical protein
MAAAMRDFDSAIVVNVSAILALYDRALERRYNWHCQSELQGPRRTTSRPKQ